MSVRKDKKEAIKRVCNNENNPGDVNFGRNTAICSVYSDIDIADDLASNLTVVLRQTWF